MLPKVLLQTFRRAVNPPSTKVAREGIGTLGLFYAYLVEFDSYCLALGLNVLPVSALHLVN